MAPHCQSNWTSLELWSTWQKQLHFTSLLPSACFPILWLLTRMLFQKQISHFRYLSCCSCKCPHCCKHSEMVGPPCFKLNMCSSESLQFDRLHTNSIFIIFIHLPSWLQILHIYHFKACWNTLEPVSHVASNKNSCCFAHA